MKLIISILLMAILVAIFAATLTHSYIGTAAYNAIEANSFQQSLDKNQARKQQQAEWSLQQAERELNFSEREQISETIVTGWNKSLPWLFGVGTAGICLILAAMVRTVSEVGGAVADKARLVARQIPMDPETGSFPLLLSEDGQYVLDVNSYASMEIGKEYAPQLQFVDRANRVRRLSIIGYSTAHIPRQGPEVYLPVANEDFE